jgi:hypothetical protein
MLLKPVVIFDLYCDEIGPMQGFIRFCRSFDKGG